MILLEYKLPDKIPDNRNSIFFISISCKYHFRAVFFCSADVHTNHHADHLGESERVRVSGDALHAEGLRGAIPPGAERGQAQHSQPEGRCHRRHHVQQIQP